MVVTPDPLKVDVLPRAEGGVSWTSRGLGPMVMFPLRSGGCPPYHQSPVKGNPLRFLRIMGEGAGQPTDASCKNLFFLLQKILQTPFFYCKEILQTPFLLQKNIAKHLFLLRTFFFIALDCIGNRKGIPYPWVGAPIKQWCGRPIGVV